MAKKYRFAFEITKVPWKARVRQFAFAAFHRKCGLSKRCCVLIPPTQSNFFPLVAVLVEEVDSLGQTLFRALQEYFDSAVCGRSMAIAFPDSMLRQTTSPVQ